MYFSEAFGFKTKLGIDFSWEANLQYTFISRYLLTYFLPKVDLQYILHTYFG